jgi:hypothetical protein
MHEKISVTLEELLAIANDEFTRRDDHRPSPVITGVNTGRGTFRLEITVGSFVFESEPLKALIALR